MDHADVDMGSASLSLGDGTGETDPDGDSLSRMTTLSLSPGVMATLAVGAQVLKFTTAVLLAFEPSPVFQPNRTRYLHIYNI